MGCSHGIPPRLSDRVPHLFCWTLGVGESPTLSRFSALKGRRNVAQGKRLFAPPWVEVTPEFPPLPRLEVRRCGEMPSGSGGEGRGVGVNAGIL
jgi:hypothetical protein